MSFVFLVIGIAISFWKLFIGFLISLVALIISIVEIKKYKSIGKYALIISIIVILFQSYLMYKRNGQLNEAKLKNAETTINYLRKSAELYYMNYFYLSGNLYNGVIVFACDGKKCYHGTDRLDIVGSIPDSGLIKISVSDNDSFDITGESIMIFDLICNFDENGKIDCVQK